MWKLYAAKGIFRQLSLVSKLRRWHQVLFLTFLNFSGYNNHYALKIYSQSKWVISFPLCLGTPGLGIVMFGDGGLEVVIVF